ncbi:MAG: glutaredoxin domain-containing protein [Gammaproteobacteria bacterium]
MTAARYDWRRGAKVALLAQLLVLIVIAAGYASARYVHIPGAGSQRIAIYTTSWCPYCAQLRARLTHNQIPYTEYDVEKSLWGRLGFWLLQGRGVPVAAVGPRIIQGYNVEQWQLALESLDYPFKPAVMMDLLNPGGESGRSSLLPAMQ